MTDQAQATDRVLFQEEARDYQNVKEARLYWLEVSAKSYQLCFHAKEEKEEERWLHVLLQALKDFVQKWLKPKVLLLAKVLDAIVLEEFSADLDEGMQEWVQQHQPQPSEEILKIGEAFAEAEKVSIKEKKPSMVFPIGCKIREGTIYWDPQSLSRQVTKK